MSELGGIIHRLEDKVYSEQTHQAAIIHLDKNEDLKGLEHLDTLYQAILKKIVLKITYQSFKARKPATNVFHPFILKEFNNRWFLIGRTGPKKQILTFALDRIIRIDYDTAIPYSNDGFDGDAHYENTIGVTVLNEGSLKDVILQIDSSNAPYVLTKPFHSSQKLMETLEDRSVVISLHVHMNFELDRLILGFGDSIKVLAPRVLRARIKKKLRLAFEKYS